MTLWIPDIREKFIELRRRHLQKDPSIAVGDTIELIGTSFIADEPMIFGEPDQSYIERELRWYESQSLNVRTIPGGPPKIWKDVSDPTGMVNSNYGFLLYSPQNGNQFNHVLNQLKMEHNGRRAVAIYTRPSMHTDWHKGGRTDFVCTNAVNYFLRDGALHSVVQMRSNDVVYGYRNDWAWQQHVVKELCAYLGDAVPGMMTWQAASLHIYKRHWGLIPVDDAETLLGLEESIH